jgi:hypothetical protein
MVAASTSLGRSGTLARGSRHVRSHVVSSPAVEEEPEYDLRAVAVLPRGYCSRNWGIAGGYPSRMWYHAAAIWRKGKRSNATTAGRRNKLEKKEENPL